MLYYIPLEHLDERYTISMDSLLQGEFRKANIKYRIIEGKQLSGNIKAGAFLDFSGTIHFKSSQIQQIAELFFHNKVKDGDVFFFSDLWFPGIDALPYMSRFNNIKIKIAGYQYAGSWTPSDFVSVYLKDYCKYIEHGWLQFIDQIYLCSNFQRKELVKNLLTTSKSDHKQISEKLIATRLPFDYKFVRSFYKLSKKLRKIIFPHRFHWEKGADTFLDMAQHISKKDKDVIFVITSGRKGSKPLADKKEIDDKYKETKRLLGNRLVYKSGLSKTDFYKELNTASVVWSGALQENFGYSVLEAATLGVTPVLPNRVVYPEFYPKKYLYNNKAEEYKKVLYYLDNPKPVSQDIIRKIDGTSEMVKYLKSLLNG